MICSFSSIPQHVFSDHIIPYLETKDFYALMRTSQHMHKNCEDNQSWESLFKTRWPLVFPFYKNDDRQQWKTRTQQHLSEQHCIQTSSIQIKLKELTTKCFKVSPTDYIMYDKGGRKFFNNDERLNESFTPYAILHLQSSISSSRKFITLKQTPRFDPKNISFIRCFERHLVLVLKQQKIKIFDYQGNPVKSFTTPQNTLSVQLIQEHVYCGLKDGTIEKWPLIQNLSPQSCKAHTFEILSLIYDESKQQLISGSLDGTIKVWDLQQKLVRTLDNKGKIRCMATFCHYVASGDTSGKISLWDLNHSAKHCLKKIEPLEEDSNLPIYDLYWDAYQLISINQLGILHIWDASTGKCLKSLKQSEIFPPEISVYSRSISILSPYYIAEIKIKDHSTSKTNKFHKKIFHIFSKAINRIL